MDTYALLQGEPLNIENMNTHALIQWQIRLLKKLHIGLSRYEHVSTSTLINIQGYPDTRTFTNIQGYPDTRTLINIQGYPDTRTLINIQGYPDTRTLINIQGYPDTRTLINIQGYPDTRTLIYIGLSRYEDVYKRLKTFQM